MCLLSKKKKDFTVNKTEKDKDQAFASEVDRDKCKQVRENINISRSSISNSKRLQRKLKFQEKE